MKILFVALTPVQMAILYMHLNAGFTHSICPKCYEEHVKPEPEKFKEA
jgi:hypothetical protein